MVIDLPSSSQIVARGNQNPVTQVTNQRLETLLTALKALNVQPGAALSAVVRAVHTVDEALRARLIQQATPPSAAASAGANRNATAPETGTDPQLLKLLHSRHLRLAEIEVQGRSLLTYTDRPVRPNQSLTLQLHHQRLMLLADRLPPAAPRHNVSGGGVTPAASLLSGQQLQTLQQALRAQLPMQADFGSDAATAISNSLQLAQLLTRLLRQPGTEALQQQIPRSVQESLQQLADHLRTPQQLAHPPVLKQAIAGSGLHLEQRLRQLLSQPPTTALTPLPRTDLKAALLQALQQLASQTGSVSAATVTAAPPAAAPAMSPSTLSPALASAPAAVRAAALPLLSALQQLLQASPQQRKAAAGKLSAEKLLHTTQQQVQQALDKLQYLQLQSLQQQTRQQSRAHQDGLPSLHLQFEIPVNWGSGTHSVPLSFDQDWITDYANEADERKEKVQQWQVKLSFELPQAGSLHAHLTVVREQLSASLWVEQTDTFAKTQAALRSLRQQLERDGCEVKQLECFQGRPPAAARMRLHCSLIDIQT